MEFKAVFGTVVCQSTNLCGFITARHREAINWRISHLPKRSSPIICGKFGDSFVGGYDKLKMQEWNCFMGRAGTWERAYTLDC